MNALARLARYTRHGNLLRLADSAAAAWSRWSLALAALGIFPKRARQKSSDQPGAMQFTRTLSGPTPPHSCARAAGRRNKNVMRPDRRQIRAGRHRSKRRSRSIPRVARPHLRRDQLDQPVIGELSGSAGIDRRRCPQRPVIGSWRQRCRPARRLPEDTPGLLTTRCRSASLSEMLAAIASAVPPCLRVAEITATASHASCLRLDITFAPWAAALRPKPCRSTRGTGDDRHLADPGRTIRSSHFSCHTSPRPLPRQAPG